MKLHTCFFKSLLVLAGLFGTLAQAQWVTNWQPACLGTNWSAYDRIKVEWHATNCGSDWRSNITLNGVTIGAVGNGGCDSNTVEIPGYAGVNLGAVKVGKRNPFIPENWNGHYSGSCTVYYEDTSNNIPPTEGYFQFYVGNYPSASLSVSKSASPPYFAVDASGQSYTITIYVSNGPTTQAISVSDSLPTGITTSGPVSATGGTLYGCPGAGSSSLAGCTIASGTYGPISITVPVSVTAAASSHSNYSAYNVATVSGGGATACSSGSCQGATSNPVMNAMDDTVNQPAGVASSTDVSVNDAYAPGSTFTATGGSCANISPLTPATNASGVLNYTLPAGSQSCTVTYQLCAPSPYTSICSSATLTVTPTAPTAGPSMTVNKALSEVGRATATDQFTVQILQNNAVVNNPLNSTTAGSGTVVTAGTGTTGSFSATANTSYAINEVASNGAVLARYNSSVGCTRNGTAQPAFSPGGTLTPTGSDTYVCTITNSPKAATLTVRQMVLGPVPVNLKPPYRLNYTGSNGWTAQPLTNNALNTLVSSSTDALTATNTDTTVSTNLPDTRWFVSSFSCTDTNAAVSGNPGTTLVTVKASSITIPATYVRAGAALRCTLILGHLTP